MENNSTQIRQDNKKQVLLPIIGLCVIVVVIYLFTKSPQQGENTPASQSLPATSQPTSALPAASGTMQTSDDFKDGTYTAAGNYTSPGGRREIEVTLTLADGVVTDSAVKVMATDPMSKMMQEDFAAHYKEAVIGKNIAELQLGKISGSSLTPKGFNDALEKIKTQTQS